MDNFTLQLIAFVKLILLTMVPFMLASQGTMLAGRSGVYVVSQEGVMLVSASVAHLVAFKTESMFLGVIAALVVGGLFGLTPAYFTTTLKMNQFVIGLTLFFVGMGLSTLIPKLVFGVTLTPPIIPAFQGLAIPGLSRIPILGDLLFNHNWMVYFSIFVSIFLYYFLYKTSYGLNIRSVGEYANAADSLGINVTRTRYICVIVGCMLIGLAGAYLPMVYTGTFTELMTKGRGWLAIALTFFGGWRPLTILYGSLFFAGIEVLAYRFQVGGSIIPYQFLLMLPYVVTIIIMMLSFRKARPPAALGKNYDREKRSV